MANTLSVMTNALRNAVSKQRIRYKENGFNLDLTYICDNIIAMGYPAPDKFEGCYRNRLEDVFKFLEENHHDHYKIYNLCLERNYDIKKFHGRVAIYPFEDHNPPTIELIQRFCNDVDSWLKSNDLNVVAVHCKAGKGRTGTMICCYLLFSGLQKTAEGALAWYDEKRTKDRKGVTIPSQRRYVQYFSKLICSGVPYKKKCLRFFEIRFADASLLHNYGTVNCSISVLQDSATQKVKVHRLKNWTLDFQKSLTLDIRNMAFVVAGDIKVEISHKSSRKTLFHFWFNTYFVPYVSVRENEGNDAKLVYALNKWEIDDAHKDKEHKCFSEDFKVWLVFYENAFEELNEKKINDQQNNISKTRSTYINCENYSYCENSNENAIVHNDCYVNKHANCKVELDNFNTNFVTNSHKDISKTNNQHFVHRPNEDLLLNIEASSDKFAIDSEWKNLTKSLKSCVRNTDLNMDFEKHDVLNQPSSCGLESNDWRHDLHAFKKKLHSVGNLNDSYINVKDDHKPSSYNCKISHCGQSSPRALIQKTIEEEEDDWESESSTDIDISKRGIVTNVNRQLIYTTESGLTCKNMTIVESETENMLCNPRDICNKKVYLKVFKNEENQIWDPQIWKSLKKKCSNAKDLNETFQYNSIKDGDANEIPINNYITDIGNKSYSKQKLKIKFKKNKFKFSQKFQWFKDYFRTNPVEFCRNFVQQTAIQQKNLVGFNKILPIVFPSSSTNIKSASESTNRKYLSSSYPGRSNTNKSKDYSVIKSKSSIALFAQLNQVYCNFKEQFSDDYYSSVCDKQLSFSNSPCKSPNSYIDNTLSKTKISDRCYNVVVVSAKPPKVNLIGFNIDQNQDGFGFEGNVHLNQKSTFSLKPNEKSNEISPLVFGHLGQILQTSDINKDRKKEEDLKISQTNLNVYCSTSNAAKEPLKKTDETLDMYKSKTSSISCITQKHSDSDDCM